MSAVWHPVCAGRAGCGTIGEWGRKRRRGAGESWPFVVLGPWNVWRGRCFWNLTCHGDVKFSLTCGKAANLLANARLGVGWR